MSKPKVDPLEKMKLAAEEFAAGVAALRTPGGPASDYLRWLKQRKQRVQRKTRRTK